MINKNLWVSLFTFGLIFSFYGKLSAEVDPVFYLDFENDFSAHCYGQDVLPSSGFSPSLEPRIGIAYSKCLDQVEVSKKTPFVPLSFKLDKFLSHLKDSKTCSLTVTMWFKRVNADYQGNAPNYLLAIPGMLQVHDWGGYDCGMMSLKILSGSRVTVDASGWYNAHFIDREDEWIFLAFVFDGTSEKNNFSAYVGSEYTAIDLDLTESKPTGGLENISSESIVIGARNLNGDTPFNGMIDNVRIYASDDNRGALSHEQIEKIRREDLGSNWLSYVEQAKQKKNKENQKKLETLKEVFWDDQINVHEVDIHHRVFPDQPADPVSDSVVQAVPKGSKVPFQFVLRSMKASNCKMAVNGIRKGENTFKFGSEIKYLLPVHVEANNCGQFAAEPGKKPYRRWIDKFDQFIREAPFDVAEAMVVSDSVDLKPLEYTAVIFDIEVPRDAEPGIYTANVTFEFKGQTIIRPVSFEVFDVALPKKSKMGSLHLLWARPEYFDPFDPPEYWSEHHWDLIISAGKLLRDYGDNVMWTPLFNYKKPLIQIIKKKDGTWDYDFSRFDKWVEKFKGLGYETFAGRQFMDMPLEHDAGGIYYYDQSTNKVVPAFTTLENAKQPLPDTLAYIDFMRPHMKALYQHLKEKNWVDHYIQFLNDEPGSLELYSMLADMLHETMPGIKSTDEINSLGDQYAELCDIPGIALTDIAGIQKQVADFKEKGRTIWMYHCTSPYPPFANRHLDEPLTNHRLYGWFTHYVNAEGYIWFGVNLYRGADPYKTSTGPLGGNHPRYPAHPPGDNWLMYPAKDTMRASMRMLMWREAVVDFNLLKMLEEQDPSKAKKMVRMIVGDNLLDYTNKPLDFHLARRALLNELSKIY